MKKVIIISFLSVALLFSFFVVNAQDSQSELQKKIQDYQNKLNEIRQQKNTLASQIEYMNTQIYLTQLKMQETEEKIIQTQKEIEALGERIEGLDQSLNYLSQLMIEKIVEGYKTRSLSIFDYLFSDLQITHLLSRIKYLKTTRDNNQKLIIQVQQAKLNFEEQKNLREVKVKELDQLKITLEKQKLELAQQKIAKEKLLIDTQNSEAVYQKLLADAQRELAQIQKAANFLKNQGEAIKVNRGDVIGIQGNTGYSFGDHLHFGVYQYSSIDQLGDNWYNSNWVDPGSVLSSRSVEWDTGCEPRQTKTVGSGSFNWPINNPTISQGSGYTCYSSLYYQGRAHPAWDMWGPTNSPVYAAESGTAYICRNCLGDGGNGVFIFHSNGLMTLYWHLQ